MRGDRFQVLRALADCSPGIGRTSNVQVEAVAVSARLDLPVVLEALRALGEMGAVDLAFVPEPADEWLEYVIPGEKLARPTPRASRKKADNYEPAVMGLIRWFAKEAHDAGFVMVKDTFAPAQAEAAVKLLAAVEDRGRIRAVAGFALRDQRPGFHWCGKVLSVSKLAEKWDQLAADYDAYGEG